MCNASFNYIIFEIGLLHKPWNKKWNYARISNLFNIFKSCDHL